MSKSKSDLPPNILQAFKAGYDTQEIAEQFKLPEYCIYNMITRIREKDDERDQPDSPAPAECKPTLAR